MTDVEKVFRKECEELGILYDEFPYEFLENSAVNYSSIIGAMMWILKKRQDKMEAKAFLPHF